MNYYSLVLYANSFVAMLASIGQKLLFFNVFPFFGIEIPFLIAWLVVISLLLLFRTKMYNLKFLILAARYSFSTKLEQSQLARIEKSDIPMQTSKAIALFGAGSNADLGSVFGVATAIAVGGRGVVFWMLAMAILSSGIRLMEVFISHATRQISHEKKLIVGGPQYYIQAAFERYGLHKVGNFFSFVFSVCLIISTLCSPQINQTVMIITHFNPGLAQYTFFISCAASLMILATLFGGFGVMARLSRRFIPLIGMIYALATLIIILFNIENLAPSVRGIFADAFSLKAGISGLIGTVIIATQRAIFCSENGMGSSSISHLNSANNNSLMEGVISTITPILSVAVVCFCSGLIVIITNSYKIPGANGIGMMVSAFSTVHPYFKVILVLIIPLFGMSTAMAWSYYGQTVWVNIFGKKSKNIYNMILFVAYCICGSSTNFSSILALADVCNLSITIPHLIGIIMISTVYVKRIRADFSKPLKVISDTFDKEIEAQNQ